MKAIIFAAGKGVRLQPLTLQTPKPLIKVGGKEIIVRILENLPDMISDVILVVGYKAGVIKKFIGTNYAGKKIHYCVQKNLRGTADALFLGKKLLINESSFLVLNGDDIYTKEDLTVLLDEKQPAVLVRLMDDAARFGVVESDENGLVTEIKEKPQDIDSQKKYPVATGAYVLTPDIFSIPKIKVAPQEYGLPPMVALLAQKVPVRALEATMWLPCGTFDEIAVAEKYFKKK